MAILFSNNKSIEKKHFVYLIRSTEDDTWYYGYTTNVIKRLEFHNSGKSQYTKSRVPWLLIFLRRYDLKRDALIFEKHLKRTRNKAYLLRKYKDYFI